MVERTIHERHDLWAIRADGHEGVTRLVRYFESRQNAEEESRRKRYGDHQGVVRTTLWHDEERLWYEATVKPIRVEA